MRAEVAQIIGTRLEWRCMPPPDLILHNGKIITLDQSSRIAQAISVRAGQVIAVGDDAALLKEAAPTTQRVDLAGRSVLPGFFDAHPHADREGLKARGGIPIADLHSVAEIVEVVKRAAQTAPAGEWIVLMPMGEPPHEYISRPEQLIDGRFPTRHDLDAAAPDHAVYIRAVWGWWSRRPFPSVANSLALRRAWVTRDTPAPHNVEIVKDARGEPTGVFLEKNFVPVLEYTLLRDLPRFKYSDRVESVRLGARAYVAAGTTSLYEGHGLTPTVIRAYRENAERGALPLRMHTPDQHAERGVRRQTAARSLLSLCRRRRRPRPRRRHPARGRNQSGRPCRQHRRGHYRGRLSLRSVGRTFLPSDDAGALRDARHRSGAARAARELRGQPRSRIRAERLRGDRQGGADPRPPLGGHPRQSGERRADPAHEGARGHCHGGAGFPLDGRRPLRPRPARRGGHPHPT